MQQMLVGDLVAVGARDVVLAPVADVFLRAGGKLGDEDGVLNEHG